jgi:hypothetical protein
MTEAHELPTAFLVLGRLDKTRSVVAVAMNLCEHFEHRLVCAAV